MACRGAVRVATPYSPELNPIERVWRNLKDDLAWQHFADPDAQQVCVGNVLQACGALTLQALTVMHL